MDLSELFRTISVLQQHYLGFPLRQQVFYRLFTLCQERKL